MMRLKLSAQALRDMVGTLSATVSRFPLPLGAALVAVLIGLSEIHGLDWDSHRLLKTAALSFFLFLAVKLFSESRELTWPPALGLAALLLALLVLRIYTLPDRFALEFMFLAPGLILLATVAPFLAMKTTDEAFWDFNRAAGLSCALGFLGALIVGLGLMSSLYAIDKLFPIDIADEYFQDIMVVALGLLWPCLALAGIPADFAATAVEIPSGLKLLVGKILIPLVIGFLAILYAYLAKILMFWELPNGYVATLVSLYASTGVVTYMLIFPLRDGDDVMTRLYVRWFFPALIPLIGLLAIALQRRISDYGITEERYAVGLFGIWLALGAFTVIISKRAKLRNLPLLLTGLLLLASFGPWGANGLSSRSQLAQFETLLEQNSLLPDGKIQPASGAIDWEDNKRISSIIRYFNRRGKEQQLIAWLNDHGLDNKETSKPFDIADGLGLELVYERQDHPQFNIFSPEPQHLTVDGFQYLVRFDLPNVSGSSTEEPNEQATYPLTSDTESDYTLTFDAKSQSLTVDTEDGASLAFPLMPVIERQRSGTGNNPPANLVLERETEQLRAELHILQLHGNIEGDKPKVTGGRGIVLIGRVR